VKRRRYLPLVLLILLLGLVATGETVHAAGSVAVFAWTCPAGVDPAGTDPAAFAAACVTEASGLRFALTAKGATRHRDSVPGQPTSWPIVDGPFTLILVIPPGQPAVVFCGTDGGTTMRFDAPVGEINAELTGDAGLTCQWYLLAADAASPQALAASPVAATSTATLAPTAMATATSTPTATATATATATSTSTTVPTATATATMTPTATAIPTTAPIPTPTATQTPVPTATPAPTSTSAPTSTPMPTATTAPTATATYTPTATTRADPQATATAVASAIADIEPAYGLLVHVLSYPLGNEYQVYPDPEGADDVGFEVEDFVLDVTFKNPDPGPDGTWDYGILFESDENQELYRVYVRADGRWFVTLGSETLREGEVRRISLEQGETNTLRLIVTDGRGILYINDRFVGSFDLGARASSGKLWLSTTNLDAPDLAFFELTIWSFP
jgi:hypothetical protein